MKRLTILAAASALLLSGGLAAQNVASPYTRRAPIPVARGEVAAVAAGGKIYVLGGTEQVAKGPPIWASTLNSEYDPATDRWRDRAPLPTGLSHIGAAELGGRIYVFGGFTNIVHMNPQPAAFVYDPSTDRWQPLPPLPTARGSVAVGAVGGKLHVFGGRQDTRVVKSPTPPGIPQIYSGFGTVTTHDVFDPATRRWSRGTPIPGPARDHVGIAVLRGKIHLFGGRVEDVVDNLVRHDVFDPRTGRWTVAAPLPDPRSAGAFAVLRGRILYAGGECKPGGHPFTPNVYDTVTLYNAATDRWSAAPPLPQGGRHGFGAATVQGVAYLIGGAPLCGGGTSTDTVEFRSDAER